MPLSASERITARFVAESHLPDPVDALREALFAAGKQMASAGFAPPHLLALRWENSDPDALDPALMPVNLAYREVFVGFRPPITRVASPIRGVRVEAECARSSTPPPEAVVARERAYSARRGVDMEAVLGRWREEGKIARNALAAAGRARLDLAYGDGPFERLDLFLPAGRGPHPCWIFLHGGYWMATDKAQYAQFACAMLEAGFAVVLPNYALAPEARLDQQVEDCLRALDFLATRALSLQLDPSRFHLSGHSAGAHLAAMVAIDPAAPALKSLMLLSGLFDLAPLALTPMGTLLGLDDPVYVAHINPLARPCPSGVRVAHALGALEAEGFFEQAGMLERSWKIEPSLIVPDANHFSLLEGLKAGSLLDLALKIAR
ncbi:MAG: alpha/beta hydrolase [Rhabdaerophilum sp.]